MPKGKRERSALHRARAVLPRNISETEESDSSIESNHDLAHIPIKDTPNLEQLTIELTMDQLAEQLATMSATLANISAEQQRQQQLINTLGAQNAAAANQAPVVQQAPAVAQPNGNFLPFLTQLNMGSVNLMGIKNS